MRTRRLAVVTLGMVAGSLSSALVAFAWTAPSSPAPSGNASAPINVSATPQVKNGALSVTGLAVFGNSLLQASSYLNWGATIGTAGYGIRDNAGAIEFKNSAGSWAGIGSAGGGQWTTSGSNIYNGNAGSVGIKTISPNTGLQIGSGGDGNANGLTIQSGYPTIYLRDIDGRGAMIHNNGSTFYILSSCSIAGEANAGNNWCSQANGYWPLYLNLNNNDAVFGGNVYAFGYFHNSDARLKKDIAPIKNGLEIVKKLQGVSYVWKATGRPALGVIAQEVEKIIPSAVSVDKVGTKSVEYDQLVAPLIESIKEQQVEIDSLKYEIEKLKATR